jgi:predicted ATP-grasp superfamily ATP-dependent carboligase
VERKMKILIFEFATAMGLEEPSITAEGQAMLQGILEDLEGLETEHLISDKFKTMKISKSDSITIHGNLKEWLHENLHNYDACLPIAPEENNLLHDITMIIEQEDVKVLGSSSNAVKITTNKFDMYNSLKGKIPVIKTEKLFFKDLNKKSFIEEYGSIFKEGISKVVKPADGVSSTGVMVVNSFKELKMSCTYLSALTQLPYCIIQEHVLGVAASVSLLSNGKTAVPLSLNFQDVRLNSGEIDYNGGSIPLEHELSDSAKETAKRAVESIEGLRGFVGVDIILDGDENSVHLVEINSRLTTPYVALRKIINLNLGIVILNALNGELPSEVFLNGKVNFYKEGNSLKVDVLK